ncbi:MAG: gluconate 2-dehydrogenase subunit 3 family protein, partial [Gemmatimonadota bacterium]
RRAAVLTGFSQFSPQDGIAAADSTEILVWHSATAIHFGVRAYETHGAPIATLAERDRITADERALVRTIADGILPRTDTPGALDVGVPAFVEIIAGEWMEAKDRDEFRAGLAALDQRTLALYGARWPDLDPVQRDGELQWGENGFDGTTPAKRAYRRLKGLVLHGYLTSETVRRDVLKVTYIHETFRGSVPVKAAPTPTRPMGGMSHA